MHTNVRFICSIDELTNFFDLVMIVQRTHTAHIRRLIVLWDETIQTAEPPVNL